MQMGYRFLPSLLTLDLGIFQTLTPGSNDPVLVKCLLAGNGRLTSFAKPG
jgi:hypothetical protein